MHWYEMNWPTGQTPHAWHTVSLTAPHAWATYLPCPHDVHGIHAEEPLDGWRNPLLHAEHAVAPDSEKVPGPQTTHWAEVALRNWPAGQGWHTELAPENQLTWNCPPVDWGYELKVTEKPVALNDVTVGCPGFHCRFVADP